MAPEMFVNDPASKSSLCRSSGFRDEFFLSHCQTLSNFYHSISFGLYQQCRHMGTRFVMLECLNIRPSRGYWNRARSEWCKVLLFTLQATLDKPKGPIRAYLTYVIGRALLRQKAVARLGAGDTLSYFAGFFQHIQFMDEAADREVRRDPGCMVMPLGWSHLLGSYCAQEMRTKKFFPNILPTDEKEGPERPQQMAETKVGSSQKKSKSDRAKSQKVASNSVKTRKKVNIKRAVRQPHSIHVGKKGPTTVTPKTVAKAGTVPKSTAAAKDAVKVSPSRKISSAAQQKDKGTPVSSGRKHGREGDEVELPVAESISQKRKRG